METSRVALLGRGRLCLARRVRVASRRPFDGKRDAAFRARPLRAVWRLSRPCRSPLRVAHCSAAPRRGRESALCVRGRGPGAAVSRPRTRRSSRGALPVRAPRRPRARPPRAAPGSSRRARAFERSVTERRARSGSLSRESRARRALFRRERTTKYVLLKKSGVRVRSPLFRKSKSSKVVKVVVETHARARTMLVCVRVSATLERVPASLSARSSWHA